eukprot:TRINITY_DN7741_c0_g1_i1.p1 TRINITY_DN7741_c0_g1~~TRINITY_DN7741_c0_g1_i1.p1  ORF type:complete len:348 (-),score=57.80 TRINITY_DN7741_c0_g1_i1:1162-2205(-)
MRVPSKQQHPFADSAEHSSGDRQLRCFCALSFLTLVAVATGSAHLRRQGGPAEPPQTLPSILNYLRVDEPGHVQWAHAVNTKAALRAALQNESIHALEADVQHLRGMDIMAGELRAEGNEHFAFARFLEEAMSSKKRKLIKLDFKDPSSLLPVLKQLQLYGESGSIEQPFILHADMLPSLGGPPVRFQPAEFINACNLLYPRGILSIGWSTDGCAASFLENEAKGHHRSAYSPRIITQMLQLLQDMAWKGHVTFPVRACLLSPPVLASLKQHLLAEDPSAPAHGRYSLTVWNDEPVSSRQLETLRTNLTASNAFVDIHDVVTGRPVRVFDGALPAPVTLHAPAASPS